MKLKNGPTRFYGKSEEFLSLYIKYSSLIETLCSGIDKERIKEVGDSIRRARILKLGMETIKKERNTVHYNLFLESVRVKPSDIKDEAEAIRNEFKDIEKRVRLLEDLPRAKKTLSELSKDNITVDNLEKYLKRAKKDGIIEKVGDSYQLSNKGLEVAYTGFSLKEFGLGEWHV